MPPSVSLNRILTLPMMILYGLGTTIGAGIYALVGEIADVAGYYAPVSFLVASLMAGFTALSYAELSARYPYAAGAAMYVRQGLGSVRLSSVVGLLVIATGTISSAALLNGFVGYLQHFVPVDRTVSMLVLVMLLGGIAAWGIKESVLLAGVITLVEIGGLLLVIAASGSGWTTLPQRWPMLVPGFDFAAWQGIAAGAVLAFYAFIGFEDMVDVAEEVVEVKRSLPAAIIWTLALTTVLYFTLMISAMLAVPLETLAASSAPLALIYQRYTGGSGVLLGVIGMLAIVNGALVQMVMVSRVLYGMSARGQLRSILSRIHARTRTPLIATALTVAMVLALSLVGSLAALAEATAMVVLTVFTLVNLALLRIKQREPHPDGVRTFPVWIPWAGFAISGVFVAGKLVAWLAEIG